MCGIAGYFGYQEIDAGRRTACLTLMARRGPDAVGEVTCMTRSGRRAYLLHSRLSIIDLDPRANQPYSESGNQLSFNGEIYNYLELKRELTAEGQSFSTASDTEVLSRLLTVYGERAISRCEGMWAFAWFNEQSGSLLLSRDRFGEKPLYLYESDSGVYFGSEPKFIFALLGGRLPVNQAQLKRYLVNGYKSLYKQPETFYTGLQELPAGHTFQYDSLGKRTINRYWTPVFGNIEDSMTYDEAVEGVRYRLVEAMKLRLRADVPIAFCLSGGVDSNALISIAKNVLGYDVHGFTIMNTDSRYEERDMVELAVREMHLEHTAIPVDTSDFLSGLRELICYHDAPVYTITYFAQWRLMEAIKGSGYKVSVSGTAADEIFSGYYDHHNAYLAEMAVENSSFHETALANWKRVVEPLVRNPYLQNPNYFLEDMDERSHIYLDADVFKAFLVDEWTEAFCEEKYCDSLLRNRMANELLHESVPVILHEDDLNSMYYSVENRTPLLDSELFEWSTRIPTRYLVRDGMAKAVLRSAVTNIAPEAVIKNPRKVGFNAPLRSYLDTSSNTVRDDILGSSPIFEMVRRDMIEDMLGHEELPNSRSKFLFNFVCAKIFLEQQAG